MFRKYKIPFELDAPEATLAHREIILRKPFLKRLYTDWYNQIVHKSKSINNGIYLEIGSGGGFLKEIFPDIVTSDILNLPNVDRVFSAEELPFENNELAVIIMVNTFHHIPNPHLFLSEAERALIPGGKIIMIEPANSLFGRFIYKHFHHEPFDEHGARQIKSGRPLSNSNQALPFIYFERDLDQFKKDYPTLKINSVRYHSPFSYIISGGFSRSAMLPYFMYNPIKAVEWLLNPLSKQLGLFCTIELNKADHENLLSSLKPSSPWGAVLFLVVVFSGIIRFYNLGFESLWMDEFIQTYTYSSSSIQEIITKAASQQQPPLDYLIGFALDRLGLAQSDWWVRFPSAFFGVGAVTLLVWWSSKTLGNYTALAAGVILAVSPLHFTMSQEARPYTIFVFFTLLCLLFFAKAYTKPSIKNLSLFSTALFLLLLTRWVGPIVITINIFIFIMAHSLYVRVAKRRDPDPREIPLKRILASLFLASALYLPFFFNILKYSQAYIAEGGDKSLSGLVSQYAEMLKSALTECFASLWVAPFILAGLVVILSYLYLERKSAGRTDNQQKQDTLYLLIFLSVLTGFIVTYPLLYVLKSKVPPKPQYLLLLAPWGAFCLGALIDGIRKLLTVHSKALGTIAFVVLCLAFTLPMYNQTAYLLGSKQKSNWRGLGEVVNQYVESQPTLFISITNAFTSWSPPIYSIPRYIKNVENHLTIRTMASGDYNKDYKFGTIYAVVYKDFHGIFPAPKAKPLKNLQIHDFNELILYRYPGSPENSTERLIQLLSYLASGADKGSGLVEVYLAKSQALLGSGHVQAAKSAFNEAFSQCRNQNERNIFLQRMETGQINLQ